MQPTRCLTVLPAAALTLALELAHNAWYDRTRLLWPWVTKVSADFSGAIAGGSRQRLLLAYDHSKSWSKYFTQASESKTPLCKENLTIYPLVPAPYLFY